MSDNYGPGDAIVFVNTAPDLTLNKHTCFDQERCYPGCPVYEHWRAEHFPSEMEKVSRARVFLVVDNIICSFEYFALSLFEASPRVGYLIDLYSECAPVESSRYLQVRNHLWQTDEERLASYHRRYIIRMLSRTAAFPHSGMAKAFSAIMNLKDNPDRWTP